MPPVRVGNCLDSRTTKRSKPLRPSGTALPSFPFACRALAFSSSPLLGEVGAFVVTRFALALRQPLVEVRASRVQIVRALVCVLGRAVRLFGTLACFAASLCGLAGLIGLLCQRRQGTASAFDQ
jgi:hypothetical protein